MTLAPQTLLPSVQPTGHAWATVMPPADLLALFQTHAPAFGVSGFRKLTWTEPLPGVVTKKARTRPIGNPAPPSASPGRGFSPGVRVLGGSALYPAINHVEFAVYHALTRLGIPSTNVHEFLADQRHAVASVWERSITQYRSYWAPLRDRDIWLYAVGEALWRNAWGLHARRPRTRDMLAVPAAIHDAMALTTAQVRQGLIADLEALRQMVAVRHPMLEWPSIWAALEAWLRVEPAAVDAWINPTGMNGQDFQEAVALLLQRVGFPEATVIGGPHDGGVDIRVPDPRPGIVWGVQTKLRTSGVVSATAVEEVVHGCRRRGHWQPWLIISTAQATEAVREACQRHDVRLWTGDHLVQAAESLAWSPAELLAVGRSQASSATSS